MQLESPLGYICDGLGTSWYGFEGTSLRLLGRRRDLGPYSPSLGQLRFQINKVYTKVFNLRHSLQLNVRHPKKKRPR